VVEPSGVDVGVASLVMGQTVVVREIVSVVTCPVEHFVIEEWHDVIV